MNIVQIIMAILTFVRQFGQTARPVIEAELSSLLAQGKITQATYDGLELFLNVVLGSPTPLQAKASGTPTAAAFRALAGY